VSTRESSSDFRVAIARSGAAVAAWTTSGGRLLVSGRRPGGRFEIARRFDRNRRNNTVVQDVRVAVSSAGRSVIGWTQQRGEGPERMFGAFRSPFGLRSPPHRLGRADYLGTVGGAAIDGRGRGRLAWRTGGRVRVARGR
jgi:hypothetical protein